MSALQVRAVGATSEGETCVCLKGIEFQQTTGFNVWIMDDNGPFLDCLLIKHVSFHRNVTLPEDINGCVHFTA